MSILNNENWRILLIDDDEEDYIITLALLRQIKERKSSLDWASTYEEGLEKLRASCYDAVLIDYDLGSATGLDLIRSVAGCGYPSPLILYTGRGSFELDMQALQAGATLYITKSEVNPLLLERFIRYAIERKQAEEKLAYQAELLSKVNDAVVGTDDQLAITYWNKAAEETFGWKEAEVLGRSTGEVFQTQIPGSTRDAEISKLMEMGHYENDVHYRRKDGVYITVHAKAIVLKGPQGEFKGLVSSLRDISERKRLEENLKESERRYRDLVQFAPAGIYEIDFRTTRFTTVNDLMCELTGYSRQELLEMNPLDILDNEGKLLFQERTRRWLAGDIPEENVEYKVRAKDGHTIYVILNTTFKTDENGAPLGATVVGQDITRLKLAQQAAREYAEMLEQSNRELENIVFLASRDLHEPLMKMVELGVPISDKVTPLLNEAERSDLQQIFIYVDQMHKMIDDLLARSRTTLP